jgi:CheY-like chemotaxis protein
VMRNPDELAQQSKYLGTAGYQVLAVPSLGEALQKMGDSFHPGLVLVGLEVLEEEGFEALELLRQDPRIGPAPILLLADRELSETERSRLDGQVMRVLKSKPYDREQLLSSVAGMLATLTGGSEKKSEENG